MAGSIVKNIIKMNIDIVLCSENVKGAKPLATLCRIFFQCISL